MFSIVYHRPNIHAVAILPGIFQTNDPQQTDWVTPEGWSASDACGIQVAPSFVVTKSRVSRVLSDEPVLPAFSRRRSGAPVDRTAEAQRPCPPTDRGIGPAILAAALLFAGGLVLAQALFSRDAEQIRLHQQEVAPVLRHD